MTIKSITKNQRPILFFGNRRVEWIPRPGQEESGYRMDETESDSPKDLVRVARGLVREAGGKPGKCVVLLGGQLVKQRTYSIGEVPAKQIRGVLLRKAANLLEVEEHQAIFTASPLRTQEGESDQRWLISATRLDDLRGLQRQLLKDGFRPKVFLFGRQSLVLSATKFLNTGEAGDAWVIAGIEDAGVSISLVAGGDLVQQSFIPGNFSAQSAMAASVLQEMRGFESYWRRTSRGGGVDDLYIAGLSHEEAETFELACHAALPSSGFEAVGGEAGAGSEATRSKYLETCAAGVGPCGDLSLPRPARKGLLGVAAVGALSLGVWLGSEVRSNLQTKVMGHEQRAAELVAKMPDVERFESDLTQVESHLEEIEKRRKLAAMVGTRGLALSEWTSMTSQVFQDNAVLDTLHLDDGGGEMSFSASGRVAEDPNLATLRLASIDKALRNHEGLEHFKLLLPATVKGTRSGLPGLEFRVTAAIPSAKSASETESDPAGELE